VLKIRKIIDWVRTVCIESNVCFHERFYPSSKVDFVFSAEYVDLLRGKGNSSGGAGCRRDNLENEFAPA
jgi:hypothetical protein